MDKYLMTGNEAIARGAFEAGVRVCSAYPGTPSTEIFENLPLYKDSLYCEWAPNEKVAAEVAYGASIAGVRSLCAMKHVGVNVAADPIFTAAYNGVGKGFVIVSADDPSMHSSQNEQDNRHYARAAKIAMVEPADSQECLDFMKAAYEISEKFDIPVMLRTTTRVSHSKSLVSLGERTEHPTEEYVKNIKKNVASPANALVNHPKLEKNLKALEEYACTSPLNTVEMKGTKVGVITASIAYQYAKEAFPEDTSFLKLGITFPLPMALIRDFASKVEKLYIIEELDGYMENEIKAAGNLKGEVPMMGYVGAFTYAEVISGYTSFYLGAKSVCPSVTMDVKFTGSWYDETKEKQAAEALIAGGCVLISQHADSMGAPTACEAAGVPNVSYNGSTAAACPKTFLVSSRINWVPYFKYMITQVAKGEAIVADYTGTIETGSVVLTEMGKNARAKAQPDVLENIYKTLKNL